MTVEDKEISSYSASDTCLSVPSPGLQNGSPAHDNTLPGDSNTHIPNVLQVPFLAAAHMAVSNTSLVRACSYKDLDLHAQTVVYSDPLKISFTEKLKLTQNLLVLSVGFMLSYSAFNAMQNLASSVLQKNQLGLISLSCSYAFAIISCFLSPWIIKKLTPKWALVTSYVLLTLFLASMLYPKLYTVIPTSILWGLAVGPLWTVGGMYVTTTGMNYGVRVAGSVPRYISQFTGIWMMFQQSSQMIGNLISSLVLRTESGLPDIYAGRKCGADYDSNWTMFNSTMFNTTTENATDVTMETGDNGLFLLGSIYVTFVVLAAVLSAIFMRRFKHCTEEMDYGSVVSCVEHVTDQLETRDLLISTVTLMRNQKMYLLIPLSYMVGMQMVYLFADFTNAFVSCGLGVNYIGFTMIAFGVGNTIGCYASGRLYPILGRLTLFTTAFTLNMALYITMLLWKPAADQYVLYFALPTIWSLADAILQTQTMAFLGYLFPVRQEIAFSNYNLFKCLGMAVTYAYSGHINLYKKLYLAVGISGFCIASYYLLEFYVRRGRSARRQAKLDKNNAKSTEKELQIPEVQFPNEDLNFHKSAVNKLKKGISTNTI